MNFLFPLAAIMSMLSLSVALPQGTSSRYGSLIADDGPAFKCYDITCIPGTDGDAQCAYYNCTEGCLPTASKCGV